MQQSGCDPSMAAIGIQHNVFPLEHSLRGDQQDAIPRQPPLVTPASAASPFFLAYIPSLDTCMPIDPQQVGAGPSRAGPLPTNDCIWLHDAWVPFVHAQDAQNPSYAQVVGQETATSSPPTPQQSTPPPPTPKEGIDEFCLLVFGPHPRHTSLRSAKFAVAQVMRLTTPPIVLPLLAGRWHQPKKPSKKSARSSICINVDRSHAIHITAQQEQQLSKLLRQQYKWRCLLLKNKDAFHHQELQELQPIANPAQQQLPATRLADSSARANSSCTYGGLAASKGWPKGFTPSSRFSCCSHTASAEPVFSTPS